jgi:hypothetical protein
MYFEKVELWVMNGNLAKHGLEEHEGTLRIYAVVF